MLISLSAACLLLLCYTAQALPTQPNSKTAAPLPTKSQLSIEHDKNGMAVTPPSNVRTPHATSGSSDVEESPAQQTSEIEQFIERMGNVPRHVQHHDVTSRNLESPSTSNAIKSPVQQKSDIELFIERMSKHGDSQHNSQKDLAGNVPYGRTISRDDPTGVAHPERTITSQQDVEANDIPQWAHEASIHQPVKIAHPKKTETTPPHVETENIPQWAHEASIDQPVKIAHPKKAETSHEHVKAQPIPQWAHEASIDQPVRTAQQAPEVPSRRDSQSSKESPEEQKSELELFIERMRKKNQQDLVRVSAKDGNEREAKGVRTEDIPQWAHEASIDQPVRNTHPKKTETTHDGVKTEVIPKWAHEASIDQPVNIAHQGTDVSSKSASKPSNVEGSPVEKKSEIELFIERMRKKEQQDLVAISGKNADEMGESLEAAHSEETEAKGVNSEDVPQWAHEASIDQPVKIEHKASDVSPRGTSQSSSVDKPSAGQKSEIELFIERMRKKMDSRGVRQNDLVGVFGKDGHEISVDDPVTVAYREETEPKETKTKKTPGSSPSDGPEVPQAAFQRQFEMSTETGDVQTKSAKENALFGEYGATIMIVLGAGAAALLLILVAVVVFVLYYCSAEARGRRQQKKLMVLNKDLNRWDPQVLRPSKENIDAFVFGSPMPSVSEMLTKY